MRRLHGSWSDVQGKGFLVSLCIAFLGSTVGFAFYTVLTAKAPGESHCYGGVCHRVFTLDETQRMIGRTVDIIATHYDAPGIDKYNVGQYTSSGEEFDANNPARAAASNYPDGTELLVWHPETKRAAHIRVNDFGPFMGQRTLDVTRKVAENMGFATKGVATLKVTVIWAQSASDPNYRKGRIYPSSLGLIGVVEPYQHPVLVERLIATAQARNRWNQPTPPLVALLANEPPAFRPESVAEARSREAQLRLALSELAGQAPALRLAELAPELLAGTDTSVALARSSPVNTTARETQEEAALVAQAVNAWPQPRIATDVPSELTPPAGRVAMAQTPGLTSLDNSDVAELRPNPVQTPHQSVAEAGSGAANRSSVGLGPSKGVAVVQAASAAKTATTSLGGGDGDVSGIVPSDSPAVVSVARRVSSAVPDLRASPLLWIGMGLMLSTFWGAATLGRARRARSRTDAAVPHHIVIKTPADAVALARITLERAEADARQVLALELAERQVASEAEADAREALSRELALREAERDRETSMRARLDAAVAAHASAVRDLAALEASRVARVQSTDKRAPLADRVAVPAAALVAPSRTAPVATSAPSVVAPVQPPRAAANDAEMAKFPGLRNRHLVGAILGLPGAAKYWGNTIIAQARLDGTVKSGSALRVDGCVDGACYAPVILVSEGADVTGMVAADTIIVLGTVRGILTARNIMVAASGLIEGEVYYQAMSIDPQAQCDVSFSRLAPTDDPTVLGSAIYAARTASKAA